MLYEHGNCNAKLERGKTTMATTNSKANFFEMHDANGWKLTTPLYIKPMRIYPPWKNLIRKNINVNVWMGRWYVLRGCERDDEVLFYTCQSSPGAGSRPYLIRFFRGCSPNYECESRIELFGIFERDIFDIPLAVVVSTIRMSYVVELNKFVARWCIYTKLYFYET